MFSTKRKASSVRRNMKRREQLLATAQTVMHSSVKSALIVTKSSVVSRNTNHKVLNLLYKKVEQRKVISLAVLSTEKAVSFIVTLVMR